MERRDWVKRMVAAGGILTVEGSLRAMAESYPVEDRVMPAFFIGHGSPMNAIEDNAFTKGWKEAMSDVPRPKAIICFSAHWLTRGTLVTAMEKPRTIHDFSGFPRELSSVEYAAPENPELAKLVSETAKKTSIGFDRDWGLDHGTWSILRPIYPKADIPVLEVSIDYGRPGAWHYELAQEFASLRRRGVLLIGSGNMVHNLGMIDFKMRDRGFDWADEINDLFKKHILDGNHRPLLDYTKLGRAAKLAIPTPDHYYPLLYSLGLKLDEEPVTLFNDQATMGSLTMTSVRLG